MLEWACRRAGVSTDTLTKRQSLKKLPEWLSEDEQPTVKQLEDFAKATHTPFGFFFLAEPPDEPVPIPDFRTMRGERVQRPSADMLDTIYMCQQRQDWYRQHAQLMGEEPLAFVSSVRVGANVVETAASIRQALRLDSPLSTYAGTNGEALRVLLERVDALGVLVMVTGYVGTNTRRRLDPDEFRGFALVDPLAPLIFVNGRDSKAAQLFALVHELAHIWAEESGVSDVTAASTPRVEIVRWCHAVAVVVLRNLGPWHNDHAPGPASLRPATKHLSPRLVRAVIASTREDRTTFTEAFRLLGCRNGKALDNLARRVGLAELALETDP